MKTNPGQKLACLVIAVFCAAACSSDKKNSDAPSRPAAGGGGAGGDDAPHEVVVLEDTKGIEGIDSYKGLRGTGFAVKNYLQLKTAAEACLGGGLGVVSADMFAPGRCQGAKTAAAPAPGDKLTILGADKCAVQGQNIYDVLKDQLWSPELAGRTDTLSNELTPGYLQAMALAADVYVHSVQDPGSLCDTKEKTKILLHKCIAQYDDKALDKAVDAIQVLCAGGGVQARQALATILGSAAFAAAAPQDK